MREGLAREFPEAVSGVDWVRARLGVRRETVAWGAISGAGAGLIVGWVVHALVALTNEASLAFNAALPFPLFPGITIAGTAAGSAVALRAGGSLALAAYITYVAAGIALSLSGLMLFCERSGGAFPAPGPDQCTVAGFLMSLWPDVIGIGLGIVLGQAIVSRSHGMNPLLRVGGALALAQFAATRILGATMADTADASVNALTLAAGFSVAAVAAGAVAAQLPRGVRSAAVVAAVWLLPWLTTSIAFVSRPIGPISPDNVLPVVASIVIVPIAAALLVLTAAVASRARFTPTALRTVER